MDISYKCTRYQQDIEVEDEHEEINTAEIVIPVNVTLESAITFYEQHAEGVYELLYKRTANWLKMLFGNTIMKQSMSGTPDAVKQFIADRISAKEVGKEKDMIEGADEK